MEKAQAIKLAEHTVDEDESNQPKKNKLIYSTQARSKDGFSERYLK